MLRELGRGATGTIYLAFEKKMNREVALKLLNAAENSRDTSERRFLNEIEMIASLDHQGIVPVYRSGEIEGRPFFTMKFFEGGSLESMMEDFRQPQEAVRVMRIITGAIQYAHDKGILHRDFEYPP